MAAKDSNSAPVSEIIFGGNSKSAPPALKRTVSQTRFKTARAELKALTALIEQACQLLKAFRKMLNVLLSIILLVGFIWLALHTKLESLQNLKSGFIQLYGLVRKL